MDQEQKNKITLAATVLIFVGLMFVAWQSEQRIYEVNGQLVVRADQHDPDALVFAWRDGIDVPMARHFADAYDEYRGEASRIIIELNSTGGSLYEGGQVIKVIDRMKRTHKVDTRVGPRRICLSMCVPIFLQGEERSAAATARFMFHEPTLTDAITGKPVKEPEFEKEFSSQRFVDRYFVNSPMDPDWRDDLIAEWRGRDIWRSGKQLVDEGSNIVTVLN
ncbi:MAG: hypothetical protein DHS20C05_03440 [Hyphococcus sp.]|nr:MAG: hypothetical protein DHS20C05_03440 [Marinicaulis sp.]